MARQSLIPGIGFVNEATTRQSLIPGGGYINEQGGAAAVTGVMSGTCAADTMTAASGKLTFLGSMNSTGAADTMTGAAGKLTFTGILLSTSSLDTMTAASGLFVIPVTGVMAATGAADSMQASGRTGPLSKPIITAASGRRHDTPMAKKRHHIEPKEEIDWHAIEEKRSADLKAMVEEMFIPKPIVVKTTEKPRKQEYLAPHFASISEEEETHELEYLLLLAA